MSAAFATSQEIAATFPFAFSPIFAFASASVSGLRARTATSAPDWAKRSAIASPNPLLPPVITALFPSRRISISCLLFRVTSGDGEAVDFLQVLGGQRPFRRLQIFLDLFGRRRAGDDAGDRRPVQ